MTNRRTFLGLSALGISSLTLPLAGAAAKASKPLDVLVLGGTGFIGPHQVEALLARGHKVTLFNRGRKADLFAGRAETLVGNRDDKVDDGLGVLKSRRRWDVVLDNSGYVPRHVKDSVELLGNRCDRYLYISTTAVYDYGVGDGDRNLHRDSPLWSDIPDTEEVTGDSYGPLKAACDTLVTDTLGKKATVVRPTYIVGPGDHTDRFTYWVDRIRRGGDVLAPAGSDLEAQWIDVRDLTAFVVRLIEHGTPGSFNGAGPSTRFTNESLMWSLAAMTSEPVQFHWPSAELLKEMALWLPMMAGRQWSRHIDSTPAQAAGLELRSLADTVRDLQSWWLAQPEERRATPRGWPTLEQEAEAIRRTVG
ncbi:MAG: NAD-dependent epimerase/dehydratase family protein [Lysobacterales bacterium]